MLQVVCLFLSSLLMSVVATATPYGPSSAETRFEEGVIAFQKGDAKQARTLFMQALKERPEDASILYNLGFIEQKAKNAGMALALWRKALALQPGFQPAQRAVRFAVGKLEKAEIAHEVEVWESFRSTFLIYIALWKYLAATAIFLFIGGWFLLRYFGQRRRARMEEKPEPGFPIPGTLATIGFVFMLCLSAAKAYDDTFVRGTIVVKKIEARSSSDTSGTPLFDLYEGLEVIVRQTNGDWTQVTYPGGSTGWIPKNAILATTDPVPGQAAE